MDELDRLMTGLVAACDAALDAAAQHGAAVAAGGTKGDLARSIRPRRAGFMEREIFTDKPYAGFVEDGRPGFGVKNAKALHFFIDGREVFARSVGPAPAQHFMAKARADLESSASRIAQETLNRELGL